MLLSIFVDSSFFFNDTATTEIYTLSLHDALPISEVYAERWVAAAKTLERGLAVARSTNQDRLLIPLSGWRAMALCNALDRKSTRLNSSHANISYAVFCLKKKKKLYIYYLSRQADH